MDSKAFRTWDELINISVCRIYKLMIFIDRNILVDMKIDSKSGGKKVYSNACGSMDCRYMIKIIE